MKAWLVLFDVSKEEFHEEELPDTMPGEDKYIAVLDGCLSVIAQSRQPEFKGYEVWVMKEFGSFHSWTKLYTIATSYDPCHRPLGFTSSRKLLFMRNFYIGLRFGSLTYLVLYDHTRDEFDSFSRRNRKGSFYKSRMVNHVASLVSPRAYREIPVA
ncbi:hypothetical protein MLD38_002412 [Melastoma candidum]|nr:hypothetical protein MLD38_002412 [Melastoma candidum]